MDILCLRISIAECPSMDIRAWISMWISTLVWIKTGIQKSWLPMLISVDFWKSMHGFAMDSWTRDVLRHLPLTSFDAVRTHIPGYSCTVHGNIHAEKSIFLKILERTSVVHGYSIDLDLSLIHI